MNKNEFGILDEDYEELISYKKNELPDLKSVNESKIFIARIRHFFDFDSLNVINHIEEITFFNNSSDQNRLQYFSPDFKEYLKVLDFNDEPLQFHGYIDDYFDLQNLNTISNQQNNQNSMDDGDNRNFPFEIIIDFPKNRPMLSKEFRTLSFVDKLDLESSTSSNPMVIEIPFDQAIHNYVYIKKLQQYDAKFETAFFQRNTKDTYFSLDLAAEKSSIGNYKTSSFYTIYSYVPINDCNLIIFIKHKLKNQDSLWFYGGIGLGIGVILINIFLLFHNLHSYLPPLAAISAIAVSYLVITKGWIFMKDIDDVVDLFQRDRFKISFTLVYLSLIIIILFEVALAAYYYDTNNNPLQGILIIIIKELHHYI